LTDPAEMAHTLYKGKPTRPRPSSPSSPRPGFHRTRRARRRPEHLAGRPPDRRRPPHRLPCQGCRRRHCGACQAGPEGHPERPVRRRPLRLHRLLGPARRPHRASRRPVVTRPVSAVAPLRRFAAGLRTCRDIILSRERHTGVTTLALSPRRMFGPRLYLYVRLVGCGWRSNQAGPKVINAVGL